MYLGPMFPFAVLIANSMCILVIEGETVTALGP
jgi:hypothetical protein